MNFVCQNNLDGNGRCGHKYVTYFHTSHPQLCRYLRGSKMWVQTSAEMYGSNKQQNAKSINRKGTKLKGVKSTGYGGHFRAVQGFKYIGNEGLK